MCLNHLFQNTIFYNLFLSLVLGHDFGNQFIDLLLLLFVFSKTISKYSHGLFWKCTPPNPFTSKHLPTFISKMDEQHLTIDNSYLDSGFFCSTFIVSPLILSLLSRGSSPTSFLFSNTVSLFFLFSSLLRYLHGFT